MERKAIATLKEQIDQMQDTDSSEESVVVASPVSVCDRLLCVHCRETRQCWRASSYQH